MGGRGTTTSGGVALLELAEEEEGLVDDGERQSSAVERILLQIACKF